MFKVGIRIDGKWQYYLVDGEAAVEKTVALAIRTHRFDKVSVSRIYDMNIEERKMSNENPSCM